MRSVRTALQVLEAVSELQPVGLSELSRKLGLPKTTVQRGLSSLGDAGWLDHDPADTSRWIVSVKAFIVGSTVGNRSGLREHALPQMNILAADVGETIHLAILDGDTVVLIERIDSPHPIRAFAAVGERAPLHASSNGKVILAHLSRGRRDRYLRGDLKPITSHTITTPEGLIEELESIRARGYAVADEELQDGVVSIAAAVRGGDGAPVGSLSISGPKSRMPKSVRAEYGRKVRAIAEAIAAGLPRGPTA
jgi:IclR family transcriptional regulator, acetate operon repressor